MKMSKIAATTVLTTILLAKLFSGTAEAQARMTATEAAAQQRAQTARGHAVQGQPVIERNWNRFAAGVNIRDAPFSASFYYSNGMPFFYGIPGGIINSMWFPLEYLPRSLSRIEAETWQVYNVSRLTPPIGASIYPGPGAGAYAIPVGAPVSYVNSAPRYDAWGRPIIEPVIVSVTESGVTEELLRQIEKREEAEKKLHEYELRDAEQRGYERGLQERQPQTPQVQQPQKYTEPHRFGYAENGTICKEQFQSEGNMLMNHAFSVMAARGERSLHAYTDSTNHKLYTAIVNVSTGKVLITEDYSGFKGKTGGEFVAFEDTLLGRLGIDRKDLLPAIIYENHVGSCGITK